MTTETAKHARLVGVYHANGGFKGELSYIIGKCKGTAHCALCDITHGSNPFGKSEWKKAMRCLPIPMTLVHLNEMDNETALLIGNNSPAIAFIDGINNHIIVSKDELETCNKQPQQLYKLLIERLSKLDCQDI